MRDGGGAARRWLPAVLTVLALAAAGVAMARGSGQEEPFPHEEHAGLFPLCTGCHQGVPSGDRAAFYPDPASCASCHDGDELEEVAWSGPATEASNLAFRHPEHAERLADEGDEPAACTDCHTPSGAPRMRASGPRPERCLSCHAHQATAHYADARCESCHVPLARSGFGRDRLERLPVPESHREEGFLAAGHGEAAGAGTASCATCHTRESCTSCHVDAAETAEVAAVPEAPASMDPPVPEARYPVPASHRRDDFLSEHGRRLDPAECSTCHTRESCTTCHTGSAPEGVGRLASRSEVEAPGAAVERKAPESHASPFFAADHGAQASAAPGTCTSCHAEATCTGCHEDQQRTGFHPDNFLQRHASAAYGSRLECSNCHSRQAFCQECHVQRGTGSSGRLGPGFHDGQPLWLLRHGQPARQSLEACVSCHTQADCLQCHSQTGAFQVSPHGPGFDAEAAADRNRQVCFACHLTDPLQGGTP